MEIQSLRSRLEQQRAQGNDDQEEEFTGGYGTGTRSVSSWNQFSTKIRPLNSAPSPVPEADERLADHWFVYILRCAGGP